MEVIGRTCDFKKGGNQVLHPISEQIQRLLIEMVGAESLRQNVLGHIAVLPLVPANV